MGIVIMSEKNKNTEYRLAHTMIRVRDLDASIKFYCGILGMKILRKTDYPDWEDQLNKIYDDGVDKWKTEMVDPVKTKWPKDNSGPVE